MKLEEENRTYDPYRRIPLDAGENIVISGISGKFPESDNMKEFQDNLMNKVDMITADDRRWKLENPEIPQRIGKINGLDKFDADFFDVNFKEAHTMDPMCRLLVERAYEALFDAGINPKELRGSNTGVFVGACFSESEGTWFYEKIKVDIKGSGITGTSRAMLANRISYLLGLHGPSYTIDSACSSSLFAMEHAYRAIRTGVCDTAFVCGANLCLHPNVSLMFSRLGVLSSDGRSKSFDASANGYVRSETIGVVYLQKAKDANRIYATVVHAKTNCDGFKPQGITFPSSALQSVLLKEFYEECKISPSKLEFVEAHGTGTAVGDPEELNAIQMIFCPGRTTPLKIGAVKSNIGHAEAGSGIGQIAKIVIAYESSIIPPNMHYNKPREGVAGLVDGRLQVVAQPTPWNPGYVGISSFGFGGANAHVLLKPNTKEKINGGAPQDDLPRLIVVSGRNEEAVASILSDIESRPIDVEYVRLLHGLHKGDITGHDYRGYTILGSTTAKKLRDIQQFSKKKQPVWFVFSGIGSQWPRMGKSLLRFPIFTNAIMKCDAVLRHHRVDIYDILLNPSKSAFDNILKSIIGIAVVQIGLVDLLTALGIEADGIIGDSIGELGCAYADGCFTAEQMILSAYSLGLALIETKADMKNHCPPQTGPRLLDYMKKVIPDPKERSAKWFSTSVPRSQWSSPQAKLSSAEYHTNNLLKPGLLEETLSLIPKNAVTIEIAPHGLLQATLTKSLNPGVLNIALSQREHKENLEFFLESIGKLYEVGLQMVVWKLYPEVKLPVSRGTPMLNHLIKWNHSDDWYVTSFKAFEKIDTGERLVDVSLTDEEFEFMAGHVIDGRNLLPATGYLTLVWETVGMMMGRLFTEMPIVFEDVKFLRATTVSKDIVKLLIMIQRGTGRFEVIDGDVAIVTGRVHYTPNPEQEQMSIPTSNFDEPEVMGTRDIYKELRLRGYQYSGLFKSVKSATTNGSKGTITWAKNWIAFMDNMLQLKILGLDTRSLFVPTGIRKLTIDPRKHFHLLRNIIDAEQELKVYTNEKHDIIKSGGVEIRGLQASAISRRKPAGEPVLETYNFISHRDRAKCLLRDAIRMATHIALENHFGMKIKSLESLESGEKYPREELISPHIADTLADLPMIQADVNIVATENPFREGEALQHIITVDPKTLSPEANALILSGRNLLEPEKTETMNNLLERLRDGGIVITLESSPDDITMSSKKYGLHVIIEKTVNNCALVVLRRIQKNPKHNVVIQVNSEDFSWVNSLKAVLDGGAAHKSSGSRILLISDKRFDNGLLGMVNCIRKEPGGAAIRSVLIQDPRAPDFSLSEPLYAEQMRLDLAINVLRPKGVWGSYRHLPLGDLTPRPAYHAWANQLVKADLSSFAWMEGPIRPDREVSNLVDVIYSSINFRDIMLATGKLAAEIFVKNRADAECVLGFEYAGIAKNGRRVMGMIPCRAMANRINCDPVFSWTVPDSWSLQDAASVPCVYATSCYAFYTFGRMKKGDKVLIHAGSGGVGQAAINLALWTGCEVFTTVGTAEKRLFMRKKFPQIPDDHIGNSRDSSFEQMIMNNTNGKGVDIVLNSLAEEKLQASVRCLAEGGRFLEIGKFDMANDSRLGMSAFMKGISFYGVLLDKLFDATEDKKRGLHELMQRALDEGAIKPLNVTIFPRDQIEPAFRYMAAGKHIGKVILKIQDENNLGKPIPSFPRYHCLEDRSYLILGGLGGFGLELADWLVLRGARNLILTSRSGVKNGYQRMRIKVWESYGINVTIVSGKDSSNSRDCREILSIASKQGPVDGIYNLAVVLKDSLLENQTPETFEESFKAKAWTTKNLDELSRELCPKLRHFVVFSSVSCGRGNAGQTNYGMSNSVMERICESRATEGLPALAIQWGAVGDVGLVADMQNDDKELVIGGTLQQKITSCLHELDGFLNQNSPIVASMVVAEKKVGGSAALSLLDTVLNIMGVKDVKSVVAHTPLAELGMDSMMAVEIKQTLEREFEVSMTAQDIRALNFAKVIELNSKNLEQSKGTDSVIVEESPTGLKLLITLVGQNETMEETLLKLPTIGESGRNEVFFIPGLEGSGSIFMNLAGKIKAPATCLQLNNIDTEMTIPALADKFLPHLLKINKGKKNFFIIGYSFGSGVAIELVRRLEAQSLNCKLILIDGSPLFMKAMKKQQLPSQSNEELQTNLLLGITDIVAPVLTKLMIVELKKCKSWEEKLEVLMEQLPVGNSGISIGQRKNICHCIYKRLLAIDSYDISNFPRIKSSILLLKPTIEAVKNLPEDYDLSKVTSGEIQHHTITGNHLTILDNLQVISIINGEPIDDAIETKENGGHNLKNGHHK